MLPLFFSFQRGVAPLHLASRHGHAHLIRLLLDHGADVNLPSRGGVCGLHLSSRCGHANAVELLLDKGTIHIRDHPYITSAKRSVGGWSVGWLMFAGLGIKGPIFSEQYWYRFHCQKMCCVLS